MKGFSIIVCCYNSSEKLEATLKFLCNLDCNDKFDYEIVIIDNGSTDDTFLIAENFINSVTKSVKLIKEVQVGKVYALNKGFNEAMYEYLVVCDDDVWLSNDYLMNAFRILESNKMIGVIGGYGELCKKDMALPKWFEDAKGAYALGYQCKKTGDISLFDGAVWGAGMVVRKSAWISIVNKGFKNYLTGRKGSNVIMAGEDTELCLLIKYIGFKIYYSDELKYHHNISSNRINWPSLLDLYEGFYRSQVYFELYNSILFEDTGFQRSYTKLLINYIKKFFSGFSSTKWFKIFYITFVEKREGYFYGFEHRKAYFQLSEFWRIRKQYKTIVKQIFSLRC